MTNNGEESGDDDDPMFGGRIRQYALDNKGPFVVHIRSKSTKHPLESRKISKFIRDTFKTNVTMRQVNENKISVEFSEKVEPGTNRIIFTNDNARKDANELPNCKELNRKYRVYIQEKDVEIIGCVKYAAPQEALDICTFGEGKFKNPKLPSIKILEASRFYSKTEEVDENGGVKLKPSNDVRVTFSGLILPDFVVIDQLMIPVRKFHKKQMFCESCKGYNHTEKFCNNKKLEVTNKASCIHCKVDTHQTGDKGCPRRQTLEKRDKISLTKMQKKTFAEMLQQYVPDAIMPGESLLDQHFPLQLGTKRQRKQNQQSTSNTSPNESPVRKRTCENTLNTGTPPGFRNPNQDEIEADHQVKKFITDFINNMGLPPFIQNLVESFIVPIICKLVNSFTNSC